MDQDKWTGKVTEGDRRYSVSLRDWDAMKRALWRGKVGWDLVEREAKKLLDTCGHQEGCPGEEIETEQCLPGCPDREKRLSALVMLNAARQCAPQNARRPADAPYFAPSRELYSEILGELAACHAELEALRGPTPTDPNQRPAIGAAATAPAIEPPPATKLLPEATNQ